MEQNIEFAAGGSWLKNLRKEAQITKAELAEQVGAPSVEWIASLEAGLETISTNLFSGFARSFNMTVDEFSFAYGYWFGAVSRKAA